MKAVQERKNAEEEKNKVRSAVYTSLAHCDTYLKKLARAIEDGKDAEVGLRIISPYVDYNSETSSPMDSGRHGRHSGAVSGNDIYSSILPRIPGKLHSETLFIPVDSQEPTPRDVEFEKLAQKSLSEIKKHYTLEVDDLVTNKTYMEVLKDKQAQKNNPMAPLKSTTHNADKQIPHTTSLVSIRETNEESQDQKFKEDQVITEVGRIVDFYQQINTPKPSPTDEF